jgi:predicted MFS family arabinose efflux permease
MSGATHSDAGVASGLFNTTQQLGAALGVAVLSTLAAARTASLQAAGLSSASALTSGYRLAFATGAGLAVAAVIVATILLRNSGSAPRRSKITETVTPRAQV